MKPQMPQVDAACWIALGMAIASPEFALKLVNNVGKHVFGMDETMDTIYGLVEIIASEGKIPDRQRIQLAQKLGIQLINGDKFSTALLQCLAREDANAWKHRDNELMKLAKFVELATTRIKNIALRNSR